MKKPSVTLLLLALLALPVIAETPVAFTAPSYEVGFSPGGGALELIRGVIGSAKQSILVACYGFTNRDIAEDLESAAHRGVKVRIVSDEGAAKDKYSQIPVMKAAGIPVRIATRYSIMHNKFMVIDGATVETGSFNYTSAAVKSNAENVVIARNAPDLAKRYADEWARLWGEAGK